MNTPIDIRELARGTIRAAIKEIRDKFKGVKFVLITDLQTAPVLSSMYTTIELVEQNIVLLERYDLERQPLATYHAIYFLSPMTDISPFIKDFKSPLKYSAPHLLFTYNCSDSNMAKLQDNKEVIDRILTFKYLYVDYTPYDPMGFYAMCPRALDCLYSTLQQTHSFIGCIPEIVNGLVSFFFNLKTSPIIGYEKKPSMLAELKGAFEHELQSVRESCPEEVQRQFSQNDNSTLLLLIPRGCDPVTPLLHQFTYEAMVHEQIPLENDTYTSDPKNPAKLVSFNYYEDEMFRDIRYVHQADFNKEIIPRTTKYTELTRMQDHGTPEEKKHALMELTKNNKDYNSTMNHFHVTDLLSQALRNKHLYDLSKFEQQAATGYDAEANKKFKPNNAELADYMTRQGPDFLDKLCTLTCYHLCGKKLNANEISRCLMQALGNTQRGGSTSNAAQEWEPVLKNIISKFKDDFIQRDPKDVFVEESLLTNTFKPYVEELLSQLTANKFKNKLFEIPEHSGRYQNIVLFFVGGVTYAELERIEKMRQQTKGTKIYVGATQPLCYKDFLTALKTLQ